jgi:hypothetical protein
MPTVRWSWPMCPLLMRGLLRWKPEPIWWQRRLQGTRRKASVWSAPRRLLRLPRPDMWTFRSSWKAVYGRPRMWQGPLIPAYGIDARGRRRGERLRARRDRRASGRVSGGGRRRRVMREDATGWRNSITSLMARGSGRRAPGGRRPVRRARLDGRMAAARSPLPAVHGAFRKEHTLQGQSPAHPVGRGCVEGRVRHGVTRSSLRQGRAGRRRDGEDRELREAATCLREGIGETAT